MSYDSQIADGYFEHVCAIAKANGEHTFIDQFLMIRFLMAACYLYKQAHMGQHAAAMTALLQNLQEGQDANT